MVGAVRFSLRSFQQQTRLKRTRANPLIYKAVFDEEGGRLQDTRLGQLNNIYKANQENQNFVNSDERSNTQDHSRTQHKQDRKYHQQDQLKQDRRNHQQDQLKQDKKHHQQDQLKQDKRNHQQDQLRQQDQQSMQGQHNNPVRRPDRDQASLRMEEPDLEESSADFFITRYKKVHGWEKGNAQVKELGKLLTSRKQESNLIVLEGTRLINDALSAGLKPKIFAFSRVSLLKDVDTENLGKECECFHIPYDNIKLWSDLKTPTGVMAAFIKDEVKSAAVSPEALPLTLICDNVRTPDNLGGILRVAAAAGVGRVILTKGCVDPWSSKVLRAAAGAHFLVPILEKVGWESLENHVPGYPHVVIADVHTDNTQFDALERNRELLELEEAAARLGHIEPKDDDDLKLDLSYLDPELTRRYREVAVDTQPYTHFNLNPGCREAVVLIGGETEGVSDAAYRFCHKLNGSRLHIPLRNGVNSLNVISAASIVLFRVQQALI